VPLTSISGNLAGMDFDPVTGKLYLAATSESAGGYGPRLYVVDPGSGDLTEIGTLDVDLSGLEFVPDPAHVLPLPVPGPADFGNWWPIELPDGDDTIHAAAEDDRVYGDNLLIDPRYFGEGGADLIYGEGGNDTIDGQDKDDLIWGADEDLGRVSSSGVDDDVLIGGPGIDTVLQTVDNDQVLINNLLQGQGNDNLPAKDIEQAVLTGGVHDNKIDASGFTLGSVELIGLEGDDTLSGGTQADELRGGDGKDVLLGGRGNDILWGNGGDDDLIGDDDDDTYAFESADSRETDRIFENTGRGTDTLDFSTLAGHDAASVNLDDGTITSTDRVVLASDSKALENIVGSPQSDTLIGNENRNRIEGRDGNDQIEGQEGRDILSGEAGDDTLQGGKGDDSISGGLGNDRLYGQENADQLEGGSGNDWLEGGDANDRYVFADTSQDETDTLKELPGGGTDTLDFGRVSTGVEVDLSDNLGQIAVHKRRQVVTDAPSEVAYFEDVIGTPADDTITDNQADNRLQGGDGDDTYIFTSIADPQTDLIEESPGEGTDTIDFRPVSERLTIDLSKPGLDWIARNTTGLDVRQVDAVGANLENVVGGTDQNDITGNDSANRLVGGGADDTIRGLSGHDTLEGGLGDDQLFGGLGDDAYVFSRFHRKSEVNTVSEVGGGGIDTLDFRAKSVAAHIDLADHDIATFETMQVVSPDPEDFENAFGGGADDVLAGNSADNLLAGGSGDDRYVFTAAAAPDHDFIEESAGGGIDTLDFSALPATEIVQINLSTETGIGEHGSRDIDMADGSYGWYVENVLGGAAGDRITGSRYANQLTGNDGDDTICGEGGDDTINGGRGDDELRGGGGHDQFVFLGGDAGKDTLVESRGLVELGWAGGGGTDTLDFSDLATAVTVDLNLDTVQAVDAGGTIEIRLYAESFGLTLPIIVPDPANFENVLGSLTAENHLFGNQAGNLLIGGANRDELDGREGDDVLVGRDARDVLSGGAGNDVLLGDAGADALQGGGGSEPPAVDGEDRDVLVGGDGGDVLEGGGQDDILIHGLLDFDAPSGWSEEEWTIYGLRQIAVAWTVDDPYEDRVDQITAGVGADGFALVTGGTVLDDGDGDTLTGGEGRDWFFYHAADDTPVDLEPDETTGKGTAVLDAVLEQTAQQKPAADAGTSAKLDWLYEFDRIETQQRLAKKNGSAGEAVDKLLQAWPPK